MIVSVCCALSLNVGGRKRHVSAVEMGSKHPILVPRRTLRPKAPPCMASEGHDKAILRHVIRQGVHR